MSQRSGNWLLVEWTSGTREVVHVNFVKSPAEKELKIGCSLMVSCREDRELKPATLIARARARSLLSTPPKEEVAGPSSKPDDEGKDYSPSGSSWSPSQEEDSADSEEETIRKRVKLDHSNRNFLTRKSSKTITPRHRVSPIMPQEPDNTLTAVSEESNKLLRIPEREITNMQLRFNLLFKLLAELKDYKSEIRSSTQDETDKEGSLVNTVQTTETTEETGEGGNYNSSTYDDEDLNRSNDNVLITNKNKKFESANPEINQTSAADKMHDDKEWVPIGSGRTTIHVDQYRKVKWKSYTAATRSLLLATFPRRVLATHSLTGRPSPAFKNKPPKMCLDARITSDIIIEVTGRFNVKENLVRSIITTKCADECKMWRQRKKKQSETSTSTKSSNQENEPPVEETGGDDGPSS